MPTKRAIILIIGVAVCLPLLLLYREGTFHDLADWLERTYKQIFILQGTELRRLVPIQYAYYTSMAFFIAWVCMETPLPSRQFGIMFGTAFLTVLLSPALAFSSLLFEPFSGLLAILASGLLGIAVSGTERGQRAHTLRRLFVGRLSAKGFESLASAKEPPKLTVRRELTVLNCRVLNYGELGSQLEPEELEKLSADFLKVVAEFLVSKGGYLDTCNEDGVRVLFGFPLADDQHAVTACQVAVELRQRLINLTGEMDNRWHKKPALGVALASGEMTCGLFGVGDFQFYGAVGESLDFGHRLCSLNTVYGSLLLLGPRTFHLAKDAIEVRPMEMVYAPKIHSVSEIYELLGTKESLSEEEIRARDAFWQGVVQIRRGDHKQALENLNRARIEGRDDLPLRYFIERVEATAMEGSGGLDAKGAARHVRMLVSG